MESLEDKLKELLSGDTLIVCVGNELRGDDAAGLVVGRMLEELGVSDVVIAEGGLENAVSEIGERKPRRVLVIDAVNAGLKPGEFVLLRAEECDHGLAPSTHRIPMYMIAEILRKLYGVEEVWVLGIQVESIDLRMGLTPKVSEACTKLAELIASVLGVREQK